MVEFWSATAFEPPSSNISSPGRLGVSVSGHSSQRNEVGRLTASAQLPSEQSQKSSETPKNIQSSQDTNTEKRAKLVEVTGTMDSDIDQHSK